MKHKKETKIKEKNESLNKCKQKGLILKKKNVVVKVKKISKKRKIKRINYSQIDLNNALNALNTGLSIRKAAAAYVVPPATLSRKEI